MADVRAADLPVGSVVATAAKTWLRAPDRPDGRPLWLHSSGIRCTGWSVDEALTAGALVLRVGDGTAGEG